MLKFEVICQQDPSHFAPQKERTKQEARADSLTNAILAILAVALAVPQLIDRNVTKALWACWEEGYIPYCEPYDILQLFGVQLGITCFIGVLFALFIVALSYAMRNR